MPQWRKLLTSRTEDFDVNEMPDDFTRLVWVLMPLALDREGRCYYNGSFVKAKLMPLREDVSPEQVLQALGWFADRGLLVPYEVAGRKYFHVPGFSQEQGDTSREAESRLPAPPMPEQVKSNREADAQPPAPPMPEQVESRSGVSQELVESRSSLDSDSDTDSEKKKKTAQRAAQAQGKSASAGAAPRSAPTYPGTFQGWLDDLGRSRHPEAVLVKMVHHLWPAKPEPACSYCGKVAKQVGGNGVLCKLLWEASTAQVLGDDPLAYVLGVYKARKKEGKAQPAPASQANGNGLTDKQKLRNAVAFASLPDKGQGVEEYEQNQGP